jgi:hypothetical protein
MIRIRSADDISSPATQSHSYSRPEYGRGMVMAKRPGGPESVGGLYLMERKARTKQAIRVASGGISAIPARSPFYDSKTLTINSNCYPTW